MEIPTFHSRIANGTPAVAALRAAELIDRGFTADVYAWGGGGRQVLKLFHHAIPAHKAEREFRATRAVHLAGLPAPAVFELVEVDGRFGIVMERVDGPSMFARVQARPWTLFDAARELAELHVRVHRAGRGAALGELPAQKERLREEIEEENPLSDKQKRLALARLAALPGGDALCHGDFHPANVLYSATRGPVIIDWGRATRGDPLGDVAYTSRLMRYAQLPEWSPRYMHALLKCARSLLHRVYLKRSLELLGGTPGRVKEWEPVLAAAGWWGALGQAGRGSTMSVPPDARV